jgi:hypothetical protein
MQRFGVSLTGAIAVLLLCSASAHAQANRTFVSGMGNDSNDCSAGFPCRSFTRAVSVTNAGGEVTMLDPAGYGAVTITKSISIINDGGGEAGITETGANQDAIRVTAGASDVVTLRGLTLNGVGTGRSGIVFTGGGTLNIQNCVLRDFSQAGILYEPTISLASTVSTITVFDTIVSNNNGTFAGIVFLPISIAPGPVTVNAYLGRVQVVGNTPSGILADAGNLSAGDSLNVTIADSDISGQRTGSGVQIPTVSSDATVILVNTQLTNNLTGFKTLSPGNSYISGSTISGNGTGFSLAGGGVLNTFGNNYITDATNTGSLTSITQK